MNAYGGLSGVKSAGGGRGKEKEEGVKGCMYTTYIPAYIHMETGQ
jgi:hypothetical protein